MRPGTGERVRQAAAALVLLAAVRAGAEEPRLSAQVDRTELAQDEVLTLEIRLEASDPPSSIELAEGGVFEVVSRAQTRQSSFSLGGGAGVRIRQVVVTQLGLAPRRAGTIEVPPVIAVVKGKRYETRPIPVKVLPAGASPGAGAGSGAGGAGPRAPSRAGAPPGGGSAFRGWERDLVLDVQLDRAEAYVGEQVTASIWLFSPLGVVEYERFTPPRWEGFWAEDLETPRTLQFQVKQVNGVPTRAYLLQRVALFPTRSGKLTLAPAELDLAVRLGGGLFDPFPEVKRLRRRSAPVALLVKPLPAGAPPGFEPVDVGTFSLEATVSEPRATAGQPLTVRITAAGEGNVRALALPRLPPIPGTRTFDPTTSEKAENRGGRLAGSRSVETVLVPEQTGELVIPSLAWPWFDPRAGRYQVARTAELRVPVSPAAPGGAGAIAAGSNAIAAGLRPIRTEADLRRAGPPAWRTPGFAAALAAPPLAFLAVVLAGRLRARAASGPARRRAAARAARRRLEGARRRLAGGDRAAFLAELDRALLGYASDRLGRPATGLTREALLAALARGGAHTPALRALSSALEAADAARFGAKAAGEELIALASRALALLEESDWGEEGRV